MSVAFGQLASNSSIEKISELELQILTNSLELRECQKYTSNEISEINFKFDNEKDMVRNDLKDADKNSSEYTDLLRELEELSDEQDRTVAPKEAEISDKEKDVDEKNAALQAQLEAEKANKEQIDKMKEDSTESFNVFGN